MPSINRQRLATPGKRGIVTVWNSNPKRKMIAIDGIWYIEHYSDSEYVTMGYARRPCGIWQTVRYHVLHGLLMGYRLLPVLRFAWRNRRSFEEEAC